MIYEGTKGSGTLLARLYKDVPKIRGHLQLSVQGLSLRHWKWILMIGCESVESVPHHAHTLSAGNEKNNSE